MLVANLVEIDRVFALQCCIQTFKNTFLSLAKTDISTNLDSLTITILPQYYCNCICEKVKQLGPKYIEDLTLYGLGNSKEIVRGIHRHTL